MGSKFKLWFQVLCFMGHVTNRPKGTRGICLTEGQSLVE